MEGLASVDCDVSRESKDNTSMETSRVRVHSNKIGALKEARAEGEDKSEKRGRMEAQSFPSPMVFGPKGWSKESLGEASVFARLSMCTLGN
jgi:hypothetical protein